jgi:hypothetical protein
VIAFDRSQVTRNTATGSITARGGGISDVGEMTVDGSPVSGNLSTTQGAVAGGIYTGGDLVVTDSDVSANTVRGATEAAFGAGIFYTGNGGSGNKLVRSRVTGNRALGTTASQGGGVYRLFKAVVTLVASVVTDNVPDYCFPPGIVAGCTG